MEWIKIKYTPARCTLQFVRRCYSLRGIYGRFDSKIRFEIESDGQYDSRFDSNAKNDSQLPTSQCKVNNANFICCASARSVLVIL